MFVSSVKTGPPGGGTAYWAKSDAGGHLEAGSAWEPDLQAEETANDSDKTFTVPASTEWIVKWLWVELTSSVTAGNRQLCVQILDDAADVIAEIRAGAVQAASLTRYYTFSPHVTELTSFRDTDYLSTIMPEWRLPTGYGLRIYDKAAIDAAADDMVVQMMVDARDYS